MAAKPETDYDVRGELNNPFSNLNKAEKQKQLEEIKKQKESEKRAREAQIKAEKDAKKEEARRLKEQELADKITKRKSENERNATDEEHKKGEEKRLVEQRKQEEEERKRMEKEAAERQKKEDELARKRRKEEEEAEKKRKIAEEKAATKERRARELKEEEQLAAQRAQEIAAARALQKKIEEGKKKGKIPQNFIPIVWGSPDLRKEIEDVLEHPYWEAPVEAPKVEKKPVDPADTIKSTWRSTDTWLEEKWSTQTSIPWTSTTWSTIAEPKSVDPAAVAPREEEKPKSQSLVERYREIVRSVPPQPMDVVRSAEKIEDISLKLAPQAKSQAAAMWAAIEKGESVGPIQYDGFVFEAWGKMVMKKAIPVEQPKPVLPPPKEISTQESQQVAELVTELAKPKEEIYGNMKDFNTQVNKSSDVVPVTPIVAQQEESISAIATKSGYGPKPQPVAKTAYGTKPTSAEIQPVAPAPQPEAEPTPQSTKYGTKPSPAPQTYTNYGAKPASAIVESKYGAKPAPPSAEPTPETVKTLKYGAKIAPEAEPVVAKVTYGPKPTPASQEATTPSSTLKSKRESIYGRPSAASPTLVEDVRPVVAPTPTPAPAPTPVAVEVNEYGSRIASQQAAMAAMTGKKQQLPIVVENEYAYSAAPPKPTGAVKPAPQPQPQPQPQQEPPRVQPRPSIVQSLSAEQIIAMVNAMTLQQQQQAYVMLKTAASKGTQLSPQQIQLSGFLEQKFMHMAAAARQAQAAQAAQAGGAAAPTPTPTPTPTPGVRPSAPLPTPAPAAPAAAAAAASTPASPPAAAAGPQQKKGLYFLLKKQQFQFGIPGREIITLRHLDLWDDAKKKISEKVLLVVCNDVTFVSRQGEAAGTYELFDKPTQRDQASAVKSPLDKAFEITLGQAKHVLIANTPEECLHWVQTINARANFIPTEKLAEHAASKQAQPK